MEILEGCFKCLFSLCSPSCWSKCVECPGKCTSDTCSFLGSCIKNTSADCCKYICSSSCQSCSLISCLKCTDSNCTSFCCIKCLETPICIDCDNGCMNIFSFTHHIVDCSSWVHDFCANSGNCIFHCCKGFYCCPRECLITLGLNGRAYGSAQNYYGDNKTHYYPSFYPGSVMQETHNNKSNTVHNDSRNKKTTRIVKLQNNLVIANENAISINNIGPLKTENNLNLSSFDDGKSEVGKNQEIVFLKNDAFNPEINDLDFDENPDADKSQ